MGTKKMGGLVDNCNLGERRVCLTWARSRCDMACGIVGSAKAKDGELGIGHLVGVKDLEHWAGQVLGFSA